MYTIRDAEPRDYAACAAIASSIDPEPVTAQQMLENDQAARQDPALTTRRLVAEDGAGQVVGYVITHFGREAPTRGWYAWVAVHPGHRRKGAGAALFEAVARFVAEQGGTRMISRCAGTDDESFAWAQRRGFAMERQRTESVLDLTTWDGSRFAGHLDRCRASGITFVTATAIPEEMLEEVYACDVETSHDHPEYDGHDMPYSEWLHIMRTNTRPKFFAFAMDGSHVAGFSIIDLPVVPGAGAFTDYTCMRRAYRGRGLALAVKLLTVEAAIARGVSYMRTNNNPENGPMLAVNAKLGYQLIPGPRVLAWTQA